MDDSNYIAQIFVTHNFLLKYDRLSMRPNVAVQCVGIMIKSVRNCRWFVQKVRQETLITVNFVTKIRLNQEGQIVTNFVLKIYTLSKGKALAGQNVANIACGALHVKHFAYAWLRFYPAPEQSPRPPQRTP